MSKLYSVSIPAAVISTLPEEELYALLLLGHIFNELVGLHKLMIGSVLHHSKQALEQAASNGQVMMLARLFAAKVFEARTKFNSRQVREFLVKWSFPADPECETSLKNFNVEFDRCKWLAAARNDHALHYPSYETFAKSRETNEGLNVAFDAIESDYDINSFYVTADIAMNLGWFSSHPSDKIEISMDAMFDDMKSLRLAASHFIRTAIHSFAEAAAPSLTAEELSPVAMVRQTDWFIPYFVDMDDE